MKKEELEATSLVELRIIAKGKGLKNVTALRKAELIDLLLSVEEKEEKKDEKMAYGILEVMDGYGFIRCDNYLTGEDDVYVSASQIRRFRLKTGDVLLGKMREKTATEKYGALLRISSVNGVDPEIAKNRRAFEDLTPVFPNQRIKLDVNSKVSMRIVDLLSPIGKGQRGMIVSPPKAGKTTLLKDIALSVQKSNPEMHLIILLIDERPEEVTDIKETVMGKNVEVIYSTFDEQP